MLKGWVPLISKLYNRSPGLTAPPPRPHNKHLISPLKQNYHHTTNHPPLSYARTDVHTYTHIRRILPTSLSRPHPPPLLHTQHPIKQQNTHIWTHTRTLPSESRRRRASSRQE